MKKIENLLLLPIVALLILSILTGTSTIDVHIHDTYYIISNVYLTKWFSYWLVVMFLLYKLIRRKHLFIDDKWAIPHIALTIVLIALMWLPAVLSRRKMPRRYLDFTSDSLDQLIFYNNLAVITGLVFLLVQIIFLVYFTVLMFRPRRTE